MEMKPMLKSLLWLFGSALCCTVAYNGCTSLHDLGNQAVKDVLANPRQFTNREIAVSGVVGNNFAVMNMGYFRLLGDEGSALTVLSSQGMPAQGTRVTIHGTLHQAYSIGRDQMLVLVETPKQAVEPKKSS
jgi:hypothetical protein